MGYLRDDAELLIIRAKHKVDWLNLKDLNVSAIGCLYDTMAQVFDWYEVLHELKLFGLFSSLFSFCGAALGHIYIPPF